MQWLCPPHCSGALIIAGCKGDGRFVRIICAWLSESELESQIALFCVLFPQGNGALTSLTGLDSLQTVGDGLEINVSHYADVGASSSL
jgi:hypothetical protein